jgi:hypothetical protein
MGKMPPGTALVLVVLAGLAACGGPQGQGGQGSTCFRDNECEYGLVCAAVGSGERTCTSDVAGLVEQYAPAVPAAGGTANGSGGSATGGSATGGSPSNAGAPAAAGGSSGTGAAATNGGSSNAGTSTSGGGGQPATGGAQSSGGSAPTEPAAGAPSMAGNG